MEVKEKNLVSFLQSLIKIPSHENSVGVSRWVKGELEGLGYNVGSDNDGNLIAEIGSGAGFILNAHLDTVGPGEGWKSDPFGGKIKDGKVYGRGSSDCKAGVASMLEIARILKTNKPENRVVFAFTAYEEGYPIEKNGLYNILPKLKDIDKGVILEPTYNDKKMGIIIGCRGHTKYNLEILGKRGHSAYPELSDNPIYKIPKFLKGLSSFPKKNLTVKLLGKKFQDDITITEIWVKEGGNVIPSKCDVTVSRRSLPDEAPDGSFKELDKVCKETLGKGYRLELETGIQGYLFENKEFLTICESGVRESGCIPEPGFLKARIDAAILNNFSKIGTYMLGPGTIGQAHRIDECCEIDGLCKVTGAVLGIIRKWDKLQSKKA